MALFFFNDEITNPSSRLEKRAKWAAEARAQYPNKFPLIIERAQDKNTSDKLEEMANPKFLMPSTFKVAEVLTIIKKKLQLTREA
jgi:hypothetical protein